MGHTVRLWPGEYAVCRLAPDAAIPPWVATGAFCSVTRTAEELSIICRSALVPSGVRQETGWTLFELVGPFPFSSVGVLSSVIEPLARAKISVLAIATFDTDYFLTKTSDLDGVKATLEQSGHMVLVTKV